MNIKLENTIWKCHYSCQQLIQLSTAVKSTKIATNHSFVKDCEDKYIKGVSKMNKAALIVKLSMVAAADKGQQSMTRSKPFRKGGAQQQQQRDVVIVGRGGDSQGAGHEVKSLAEADLLGGGGGREGMDSQGTAGGSWKDKPPDQGKHEGTDQKTNNGKISKKAENGNDGMDMDDKAVEKQARGTMRSDGEAGETRGLREGGGEDNDRVDLQEQKAAETVGREGGNSKEK